MRKILPLLALLLAASGAAQSAPATAQPACNALTAQNIAALYENLPIELEQPALPQIPDARVSIEQFGAVGDGVTMCTAAFDKAIKALPDGGHVIVPKGVWLTGPIRLRSRIDLHVEKGAIVIFTQEKSAYLPDKGLEKRMLPCIRVEKCTDVSITGGGIIDGNGKYWRYAKRTKLSDQEWEDLQKLGGTETDGGKLWFPYDLKNVRNITDGPESEEALRQHMVSIKRCQRVLISGVTIQNAPRFHLVPSQCTDLIISGVTVRCHWNAQNGDGIDICNSQRALVTGCTVDVGDDGICMKGGSGESGVKAGPCSDFLITGNTVLHAHGGFVMGSDISGGMRRMVVKDCSFSGTDTGLRFKSAPGRGGHTEEIYIYDITMNDIREAAITFSCDYADITYKTPEQVKGLAYAPDFTGMKISKIVCRECTTGIYAHGIAGLDCVHGITVANSTFFYTGTATDIDENTAKIALDGVRFLTF